MAYHIYRLTVDTTEGDPNYLISNLVSLRLILGVEYGPVPDTSSGTATYYVKVPNKRKFETYFRKRKPESADPVRFIIGNPTYESYKSEKKKHVREGVEDCIDKGKRNKSKKKDL